MWLVEQAGAQACQEKPVFAYTANKPTEGARRGRTEWQAVRPWLRAFLEGAQEEAAASGQQSHPPLSPGAAGRQGHRLTYWKGRRMARMSPLKKRVMSSTKSTPWQDVKSNCRDGLSVSCGPQAQGRPMKAQGPWPGSTLARRPRHSAAEAVFQCSPQNLAFLPHPLQVPSPPRFSHPCDLSQPGIQARACTPPAFPVPGPTGPRADLGLEAEDGDREADEGRDAQAQQHRCGVVVTAGPRGQGLSLGAGLLVSPSPPPRPTRFARRPDPTTVRPHLPSFPMILLSCLPSFLLEPNLPTCLRLEILLRILEVVVGGFVFSI